jgi:hypothetical protein
LQQDDAGGVSWPPHEDESALPGTSAAGG